MINSKLIFVTIYLIVDILYVLISKPYYNQKVSNIQGKEMVLKNGSYISAILAYIILGIVWYVFIASYITKESTVYDVVLRGVILGLAIYGVFNTTLYVMFENWDIGVSVRDTLWGVSWITISALIYLKYIKK